jgi:hypothetical protein
VFGRKGFDDRGWVVAQAPEHVVENLKLDEKSKRDGKKFVKRRPPDKNFVNWDLNTFKRLMAAPPERLMSRFQVTHGMLLNMLSREGDGCRAMQRLIRDSHESPKAKAAHRERAWQLFRSLVERKIIEFIPRTAEGSYLRVNIELQDDFSMDQVLSLYLLETLPLLDPAAPDFALDLITLVESILEDPDIILRKQLNRVKDQAMAEMKQQGMEYQERMDELEKLEYPKPKREFIYSTFNAFADKHPWVGQENIRPKSIVREMFEEFRTFADYIKDYELQRAEGVLLRHLNSVYKVLSQTVPDATKTEPVLDMEIYLRTMIRQVDSSLLDEWEKMRAPKRGRPRPLAEESEAELRPPGAEEAEADVTRDTKTFTALVRTRIFTFLRGLVISDYEAALSTLASAEDADGQPWTAERLRKCLEDYQQEHACLRLDPEARNTRHTYAIPSEDKRSWRVQQMLVDPDGHNDWVAEFTVDLPASRAAEEPVMKLAKLGLLRI